MTLTSLHLLLTYRCTLECDHCFFWGSPHQYGTMTLDTVCSILEQAVDLGTIRSIYFEGGEPFLCYPTLLSGVREAQRKGFKTGIVSNGYWANSVEIALVKLRPLVGYLDSLTISSDLYHWNEKFENHSLNAIKAAQELGISTDVIEIASPMAESEIAQVGQLPAGVSGVMYRGRAALNLVNGKAVHSWEQFTSCPYENLRSPGRVHLDPLGYIHLCEGISMGNIFERSLKEIWDAYDAEKHPVAGPIIQGGPAELCHAYGLPHDSDYADACHLCYRSREKLRQRLPEILVPDQAYGLYSSRQSKSAGKTQRLDLHQNLKYSLRSPL